MTYPNKKSNSHTSLSLSLTPSITKPYWFSLLNSVSLSSHSYPLCHCFGLSSQVFSMKQPLNISICGSSPSSSLCSFWGFQKSCCETKSNHITPHCFPIVYRIKYKLWGLVHRTFHEVIVIQSCPILCDLMECSPPGSSVRGILQARIMEWVAISFSRGSSQLRDWTWVSPHYRQTLYQLSHREAKPFITWS